MRTSLIAAFMAATLLFAGCEGESGEAGGNSTAPKASKTAVQAVTDARAEDFDFAYESTAPGFAEERNEQAVVDYSNVSEGYVMVQYLQETEHRVRAQVQMPTEKYTYDLRPGDWAALPLSDGDGEYRVSVYENIDGDRYAQVLSCGFTVELANEFLPFLRPNQFVDYCMAPNAVATAELLTSESTDMLEKVASVYNFVVNWLSYDKEQAATVQSGYVPVIDDVLARRQGICFDYAALMTGMLRSSGIPCKLVVGYAGTVYHAWISVWVEGEGWIDNIIHFNGTEWQMMDPTFASTAGKKDAAAYAGDGTNYSPKFCY